MGKVHGSLARAGKVKSQTPKVRYFDPGGGMRCGGLAGTEGAYAAPLAGDIIQACVDAAQENSS
jgi:hypothetical protein